MQFFKIQNSEDKSWWVQDQYGYTSDEREAGWWSAEQIEDIAPPAEHKPVLYKPSAIELKLRQMRGKPTNTMN